MEHQSWQNILMFILCVYVCMCLLCFLEPHPLHMELHLPAYTTATATATATPDPSRICSVHHSSRQRQTRKLTAGLKICSLQAKMYKEGVYCSEFMKTINGQVRPSVHMQERTELLSEDRVSPVCWSRRLRSEKKKVME